MGNAGMARIATRIELRGIQLASLSSKGLSFALCADRALKTNGDSGHI
jgi:hypothetical protein